jgi:hypothetical protein
MIFWLESHLLGSKITFLEGKFSELLDREPWFFNSFSPQLRGPGANPRFITFGEIYSCPVSEAFIALLTNRWFATMNIGSPIKSRNCDSVGQRRNLYTKPQPFSHVQIRISPRNTHTHTHLSQTHTEHASYKNRTEINLWPLWHGENHKDGRGIKPLSETRRQTPSCWVDLFRCAHTVFCSGF